MTEAYVTARKLLTRRDVSHHISGDAVYMSDTLFGCGCIVSPLTFLFQGYHQLQQPCCKGFEV